MIEEITKIHWTKDWEGKLSLLLVHLGMPGYLTPLQKAFGFGLGHFLVLQHSGVSAGYWVEGELDQLGARLSGLAKNNPTVLSEWSDRLKEETDRCNKLLSQDPVIFLDPKHFREFRDADEIFTMYQLVVRRVIDYLPEFLLATHGTGLESARKYCEKTFYQFDLFVHTLAQLVAERSGCPAELVECLTGEEFELYLRSDSLPAPSILKDRYKGAGFYLSTDIRPLSFEEVEIIEKSFVNEHTNLIKGQSAYPGVVRGHVRLVKTFATEATLTEGEVLVAGMTDPNYVPLMKKAGAIVTDAGGILCHAAIVSRELKIPCIVGTKFATQVLNTGDLVEVDANTGMVRILEKVK